MKTTHICRTCALLDELFSTETQEGDRPSQPVEIQPDAAANDEAVEAEESGIPRMASAFALTVARSVIEKLFLGVLSNDKFGYRAYICDTDVECKFWELFGWRAAEFARTCDEEQVKLNVPEHERFRLDYYDSSAERWVLTKEAVDVLREVRVRIMTGRAQRDLKRANKKPVVAAAKLRAA